MTYSQSIIKEIRRKTSNGDFETPVKLGSEQKFVSALLNSHNNNLEEQSILGLDCVTIKWRDDVNNISYVTKKFYNGDLSTVSNNGYYILFTSDYSESEVTAEFFFKEEGLYLPERSISGAYFEQIDTDNNILMLDGVELYSFDSQTNTLKINPSYRIIKKEVLCLRTNLSDSSDIQSISDILISEKITAYKISDDGKEYTKEAITNYLD